MVVVLNTAIYWWLWRMQAREPNVNRFRSSMRSLQAVSLTVARSSSNISTFHLSPLKTVRYAGSQRLRIGLAIWPMQVVLLPHLCVARKPVENQS